MYGLSHDTSSIPGPPVECAGSAIFGGANTRRTSGLGAPLEPDPDTGAARSGAAPGCGRPGRGNVPARSAARRVALSGPRGGGGAARRPAAEAPETSGHPPGVGHRGDGVWAAAGGVCAVDDPRDHRGNEATRDRRRRGARDGAARCCCMNTRYWWGGVARTSRDPPQEPHYGDEVEGSSHV